MTGKDQREIEIERGVSVTKEGTTLSPYVGEFLLCAPSTPLSLAVRAFESRCHRVNIARPRRERGIEEARKFAGQLLLW